MGKRKLMLIAALVTGLALAFAGVASAATIQCGQCHGAAVGQPIPVNSDNCTNTARGLHGTHVNYSSSYFPKTVANNGKCAYCHTAVSDAKGIASATHNNNYMNITGMPGSKAPLLDYTFATKTCTNACHKNRNDSPKWGNYTATMVGGIKLNCQSCHDDSATVSTTALTGKHKNHLLSNCTTPSGTLMSAATNAGCLNCHPDNRNDLWANGKADDGTKKAYPHALDGTNVLTDNATLQGQISGATKNGLNTTCTNACHARVTTVTWGQNVDCNMCHYYAATPLDTSNTGTGALSAGHNPHFKTGNQFACTTCHPDHSAETAQLAAGHSQKLPAAGYNANVIKAGMTYNANKTCTNTQGSSGDACHGTGISPAWGATGNGCGACHYYPGAPGRDWTATGNGHLVRYDSPVVNTHLTATGYNYTTDQYATVIGVGGKCYTCHSNGVHRDRTTNVVGKGNYSCTSPDFTITVTTPGSNVTCGNVKCHSGKTTPNWW